MDHVRFSYIVASNYQAILGKIDVRISEVSVLFQFNVINFHEQNKRRVEKGRVERGMPYTVESPDNEGNHEAFCSSHSYDLAN